jgi:hypothetical protein
VACVRRREKHVGLDGETCLEKDHVDTIGVDWRVI